MTEHHRSYVSIFPRALLMGFYIAMVIGFIHMMEYMAHIKLAVSKFHINYLVYFALVYFGVKIFRDQKLGGKITFSKALSLGVLSSAFAGVLLAFDYYVYATSVHLDSKVTMGEWVVLGDRNPSSAVIFIIVFTLIVGSIISIIVAAILNKQQK